MDQLSAHLDRGWDLAQRGDALGANACAQRALEIDPQSPEVHNLLGYTAQLSGETDEALEHYRQAISLDETYLEAMLNAAEVLMHPLEDWNEALKFVDDALEYAETPEEVADCVLLKVDALLGKGDEAMAKRAMATIPDGPFEGANYLFLIGRAHYELGDFEKAAPLLEEAVKADEESSDAHYYLGLVRDERGDVRGALEEFLQSRALDLSRAAPTWAPSPTDFASVVREVVSSLDAVLATYVREAEVYIVDLPGAELVVDGVDPRARMILDALAPDDGGELPNRARLFVYQRNVERAAGTTEAIREELSAALEREITTVFLERNGEPPTPKSELN
jgi:tetratricopeptide (TPR) repeat protein